MNPTQLWADLTTYLLARWMEFIAFLRALSPEDRIAIAVGFLAFAAVMLGRVIIDWVTYRRRHGQRQRLQRIQQGYVLEASRAEESDRRVDPHAWRGVLSRAQVPTSRLGRMRYAVTRRVDAAGGRRAGRLAAGAAGAAGIGASVVLGPLLGWALAVPTALLAAVLVGGWMLQKLIQRRKDAFFQEFPEGIDMLVRAVRAGLPVSQAIESAAAELSGPVATEFRRIADELTIGTDFATALANAAARVRLQEFDFFVVTLALQRQTGGRLTEDTGRIPTAWDITINTRLYLNRPRMKSRIFTWALLWNWGWIRKFMILDLLKATGNRRPSAPGGWAGRSGWMAWR